MSDAPETVTEAVSLLAAAGYTSEFREEGEELVCLACGGHHSFSNGIVERVYRFEGPSDPADEAIVIGVRCATCHARGTIVSAFGPDADPDTFAHLIPRRQS